MKQVRCLIFAGALAALTVCTWRAASAENVSETECLLKWCPPGVNECSNCCYSKWLALDERGCHNGCKNTYYACSSNCGQQWIAVLDECGTADSCLDRAEEVYRRCNAPCIAAKGSCDSDCTARAVFDPSTCPGASAPGHCYSCQTWMGGIGCVGAPSDAC